MFVIVGEEILDVQHPIHYRTISSAQVIQKKIVPGCKKETLA